jgi:hypothetical protein
MGTRSRIAVANQDGTFSSIYCHWDGYPSGVGVTLRDHYKDPAKVSALIALGDISSLGSQIGGKHDFDDRSNGDWTLAYGRDRGETGIEAVVSKGFDELCKLTQESGGEYLYVFKGDSWYCAEGGVAFFGMPADKAPSALRSIDEVLAEESA